MGKERYGHQRTGERGKPQPECGDEKDVLREAQRRDGWLQIKKKWTWRKRRNSEPVRLPLIGVGIPLITPNPPLHPSCLPACLSACLSVCLSSALPPKDRKSTR